MLPGRIFRVGCHRCCGLICKHCLKITSALLLPLLLAIFTVVITFEQKKDNERQRLEDREMAREQRQQDLNISLLARENEREIARQQRDTDEKKRLQEFSLAEDRRKQEKDLAEDARKSSLEQQKHELHVQEENRKDNLLGTYINEIGILLEKNNGSLTANPVTAALARAKTLHVIRSIGLTRCAQLLYFLYDAGQLTRDMHPLDIAGANFDGINLSMMPLRRVALAGVHLNGAYFSGQDVSQANFDGSYLNKANFSGCKCAKTTFKRAIMNGIDFSNAGLESALFFNVTMNEAHFRKAICRRILYQEVEMSEADFSYSDLSSAVFHNVDLRNSTFYRAFSSNDISERVSFFSVRMQRTNFSHVQFQNSHFNICLFDIADFHGAEIRNSNFFRVRLIETNFREAYLDSSKFAECSFPSSDFFVAKLYAAQFVFCHFERSNFVRADLRGTHMNKSLLAFSSFMEARLLRTFFFQSDLSYANFSGCSCTNSKMCNWLDGVLSAQQTILCNGSVNTRDYSLFTIDHVPCNGSSINNIWEFERFYEVTAIQLNANESIDRCGLSSTPNITGAFLQMDINITGVQEFIKTGDAAVAVRTRMSDSVKIEMNDYYMTTQLQFVKRSSTLFQGTSFKLQSNTPLLYIWIKFDSSQQRLPLWLSYFELTIIPRRPQGGI